MVPGTDQPPGSISRFPASFAKDSLHRAENAIVQGAIFDGLVAQGMAVTAKRVIQLPAEGSRELPFEHHYAIRQIERFGNVVSREQDGETRAVP